MEETLRNGDKIELIAKKVGELFGNEKKIQYEKAVVVYASGTNPMFEIEEDERLKAIWEKTKQIVDNDRARSIHSKRNEFTDLIKSLKEKRWSGKDKLDFLLRILKRIAARIPLETCSPGWNACAPYCNRALCT